MEQAMITEARRRLMEPGKREVVTADCYSCPRRWLCPAGQLNALQLQRFNNQVQRLRVVHTGQHVIHAGDTFTGIYVVKAGTFKQFSFNREGDVQVTGFHLPGEVFGLEGISGSKFTQSVQALETSSVCRIPLNAFEGRIGQGDGAPASLLVTMMSALMLRDSLFMFSLGKMNARRRLATFLIDLSERMKRLGYREDEMILTMRRMDIGNYLGLAEETVSRLFTRFQKMGILSVNRRSIEVCDLEKLRLAASEHTMADSSRP